MSLGLLLAAPLALLAGCRPNPAWSPDGKKLALHARGFLYTFDRATGKFTRHTQGPQKAVHPVWSPDGKELLFYQLGVAGDEGERLESLGLAVLNLETRKFRAVQPRVKLPAPKDAIFPMPVELIVQFISADWSPDGKQVAYVTVKGNDMVLMLANADGSGARPLLKTPTSGIAPRWSPDGKQIAFFSTDSSLTPQVAPAPEEGMENRNGARLEVMAANGENRRILWDLDRKPQLVALGPDPVWSADGTSLTVIAAQPNMKPKEGDDGMVRVGSDALPPTCEAWSVPVGGGEPRKLGDINGPAPFVQFSRHAATTAFFHAPKEESERYPTVVSAVAPFGEQKRLYEVEPKILGIDPDNSEPETFPSPLPSPDGKEIALLFAPKKGAPVLLISNSEGGAPQRYVVPLPAPAAAKPPVRPAPKKPAPRRPLRKR